jgi:hypothetical protein
MALRVPSLFREAFRLVHSRSQKFLRNVHNLFTGALVSSSPAGLRLEIVFKIDKKKNEKKEFNFSSTNKIFLTRKEKHACRARTKKNSTADLFVTEAVVVAKGSIDSPRHGPLFPI